MSNNYYPIQLGFSSGEISPLLKAQIDSDVYQNGLDRMFNMIPDSHGPSRRRGGTRFISEIDEVEFPLKKIPFNASLDTDYIVIIGENWVQVYDDEGPVSAANGSQNLVSNGGFNSGMAGWSHNLGHSSSKVVWDLTTRTMLIKSGSPAGYFAGAYQNVGLLDTSGIQHRIKFDMFEFQAGSTYKLQISEVGGAAGGILNQAITQGTNQEFTFTPGAAVTDIRIEFLAEEGGGIIGIDRVSVHDDTLSLTLVQFASPYAGVPYREFIQWAVAPGKNPVLYLAHQFVQPRKLSYDAATNAWTFDAVTFTSKPTEWAGDSWPRAVTFFSQRSWWGGPPDAPEKFWGSKVSAFENMDLGTSQADDAIEYELEKKGDILFISGAKSLVIGTENSEYIASAQEGVLKPGDFQVDRQSAYGSYFGLHQESGDRVTYVSSTGSKLRTMAYEWTRDAWVSIDMAWPSEHIIADLISQIAYQFDPNQTIWIITGDHRLVSCSYDREQNIIGWSDHGADIVQLDSDPKAVGIAVSNFLGVDRAWISWQYSDGDDEIHTILGLYDVTQTMDGFVIYATDTETTTVPGLDHFEGMEVGVTVNGAVDPNQVVDGGEIETQTPGTLFVVGLNNTAYMKTLPKEGGNRLGTTQGAMKHLPYIFARLVDSSLPFINGKRPADRSPVTPMDTAEPLFTGDVRVDGPGWDRTGQVEIMEPLPLPLNVVSIFGKARVSPK